MRPVADHVAHLGLLLAIQVILEATALVLALGSELVDGIALAQLPLGG